MKNSVATDRAPGTAWIWPRVHKVLALDAIERLYICLLYIHFLFANLAQLGAVFDVRVVLLVMGETFPVLMILVRRPSMALSIRPADWTFGLLGTTFPLLVTPHGSNHPLLPLIVCVSLFVAGEFIQVSAKVALGTSFGLIAANRGVKMAGPYRFVRHPMYAGYTITHMAVLMTMPSLRNACLYGLALAFQLVRIQCEERVLMKDEKYRAFAARVSYRLIPGIY